MKTIFRFFASRHLLASVLTFAVLIGGFSALYTIRKDLFPRVVLNQVDIVTVYPGAAPEDVEGNCTNRIENAIRSVEGIKEVTSISAEDMSLIQVRIDDDMDRRSADNVEMQIRNAVQNVGDLPEGIEGRPEVERVRGDLLPIINVGVGGDVPYDVLRKTVKKLEKELKAIPGVAKISLHGYRAREVRIELMPDKLDLYQVPFVDIVSAVKNRNIQGTAGSLESYTTTKKVVTLCQYRSPGEVGDVIVRSSFGGPALRIKDVARIRDTYKKEEIIPGINGRPVVIMNILKKENADIVTTVNAVKSVLKNYSQSLPRGVTFQYSNDLSRYVDASFSVVMSNGITGFILVIIILTLFLNFRISFWVALGIPVSLLGTVMLLPVFDVCLDVVTLSAMILVLGIIVDDAIVISERIYHHWQKGSSPLDAAVTALDEVFWPVVGTVVSTLLAFIPMFFIPGDLGKYIIVIPIVIILSLSLSMLEAVVALPAHIVHDLGKSRIRNSARSGGRIVTGIINILKNGFSSLLSRILRWRYAALMLFIIILAGSLIYAVTMKQIFLPTSGAEEFAIFVETSSDSTLRQTSDVVRNIEKVVQQLPKSEVSSWTTLVGNQEGHLCKNNIASIRVNLTPYSTRNRNADEIVEDMRKKTGNIHGVNKLLYDVEDSGPSPGRPIDLVVAGEDDAVRRRCADTITSLLQKHRGVTGIERDDHLGKEQLEVKLNHEAMSRLGISVADVAATLRVAFDGDVVTKVQYGNELVKFRVQYPREHMNSPDDILSIAVPNRAGRLTPVRSFGVVRKKTGSAEIHHYDHERSVSIRSRLNDKDLAAGDVVRDVIKNVRMADYPGVRVVVKGEAQRTGDSYRHFSRAFFLAVVGIYLLFLLLFNSICQPLIIIAAVPFGLSGVIITFGLHNEPISFYALLGVVGLSGVVVNDSLLLVDYINQQVKENPGEPLIRLVVKSVVERSRAILMTTITTTAGVLPLAYGIGGADPTTAPMALALGWGLAFATLLTLILVPCLYVIGNDISGIIQKIRHGMSMVVRKFFSMN